MRKLLLLLLAVLLPLQWSYAAVASLCLEGSPGYGHGAVRAQASHDAHRPAAGAGPAGHHARGHAAHAHRHDATAEPGDLHHAHAGDAPGSTLGDDEQSSGGTQFDGAGCCHAGVSLPPSGALPLPVQALPPFAGLAPPMPPLSHATEGPFRPPRALSA